VTCWRAKSVDEPFKSTLTA